MTQEGKKFTASHLLVAVVGFALGALLSWFALQFMGGAGQFHQVQPPEQAQQAASAADGAQGGGSAQGGQAGQQQLAPAETASPAEPEAASSVQEGVQGAGQEAGMGVSVQEGGTYTSKDEVAAYIHAFGHLPSNYISKTKAKKAGWVSKEGNLDEVCPGMSIGGSEFYNDEGLLPDAPGRTWTECDINYQGGYRGAERIVFSNDGLIFYTADHYESFTQLY